MFFGFIRECFSWLLAKVLGGIFTKVVQLFL